MKNKYVIIKYSYPDESGYPTEIGTEKKLEYNDYAKCEYINTVLQCDPKTEKVYVMCFSKIDRDFNINEEKFYKINQTLFYPLFTEKEFIVCIEDLIKDDIKEDKLRPFIKEEISFEEALLYRYDYRFSRYYENLNREELLTSLNSKLKRISQIHITSKFLMIDSVDNAITNFIEKEISTIKNRKADELFLSFFSL